MYASRTLAIAFAVVLLLALLAVVVDAEGATRASSRSAVCSVFGKRCAVAWRVVRCETGGTFNPRAVGNAGERGLFQIHPVHFGWLKEWRLFHPRYNARIAYRLSRGGRDWSAWTCQP